MSTAKGTTGISIASSMIAFVHCRARSASSFGASTQMASCELVLWQDLVPIGGRDEAEPIYGRADYQDASGDRGPSVTG